MIEDNFIKQSEEWRDILGYEGLYQVSNLGRIRNKRGLIRKPVGAGWKYQYLAVNLSKNDKAALHYIHRLVMFAFVGACPTDMQTNHIDGDKHNNCLENLEYVTNSENQLHRCNVLGKHDRGSRNKQAVRTESKVAEMRRLHREGAYNQRQLAKIFGVVFQTVHLIVNYKSWSHVD
jgi:hypothetical protein